MTPFGDLETRLETRAPRRPVSPFVVLLLGGAATALIAEWLRFQGSPMLAIVPAALGTLITVASVTRLYRARRRWRRVDARSFGDLPDGHLDTEAGRPLTIDKEDGRLAIVHAVARDEAPSPLVAHPAGERTPNRPRSALGADRAGEASRDWIARDAASGGAASGDEASRDAAESAERLPSHVDR